MLTRSKVKGTISLTRHQLLPGEELRGVFRLVVSQRIDVTAVRIRVTGKEEGYVRKKGRHKKPHEFVYLEKLFTVFGFTKASGRKGGASLSAGTYTYPFRMTLPYSLPPTYFAQAEKLRCSMRYRVEGIVVIPNGFDARVSRRFTVFASAPRVQLTAARETESSFDKVSAFVKNGVFSKGGAVDVVLNVSPSVVQFGSEPLRSKDMSGGSGDDDDDDDESGSSASMMGSLSGTITNVSGSPTGRLTLQAAAATGTGTEEESQSPSASAARNGREGSPPQQQQQHINAAQTPARLDGVTPVNPSASGNGPAAVAAEPVHSVLMPLYGTPRAQQATPAGAQQTSPGGAAFPATVARPHGRPSDAASHVDPMTGVSPASPPATAQPPNLDDLFDFGHMQRQREEEQEQSREARHAPPDVAATVAVPARGGSQEPQVVHDLFGNASSPSDPSSRVRVASAPPDDQVSQGAGGGDCQAAAYSEDDTSSSDEDQPRTIPRGRRADSFDASLHEAPAELPQPAPPAPFVAVAPAQPQPSPVVAIPGPWSAASPPHSPTQGRSRRPNRPVMLTKEQLFAKGRSRCDVIEHGVTPPPLTPPESDAELRARITITNNSKKRLKSFDVYIVELTELMVGRKVEYGREILSKFTFTVPKGARGTEPGETIVLEGSLPMLRYLRTRGKEGSHCLPLPTIFTSMCKTKTCLEVRVHGVKLRSAIVFTNVLHLINGVDETNATVPGPLAFTTQHILREEEAAAI